MAAPSPRADSLSQEPPRSPDAERTRARSARPQRPPERVTDSDLRARPTLLRTFGNNNYEKTAPSVWRSRRGHEGRWGATARHRSTARDARRLTAAKSNSRL